MAKRNIFDDLIFSISFYFGELMLRQAEWLSGKHKNRPIGMLLVSTD
jgi:hypothetical protein